MRPLAGVYQTIRALLLAAVAGATGAGPAQADAAAAAWEAARAIGTEDACQLYLEQFPTGRHAEETFRCVIERALGSAPLGPGPAPMVGGTPPVDLY